MMPNAGRWCFSPGAGHLFIHPLALASFNEQLFVLDAGRLLHLPPIDGNGQAGDQPSILLQPGDMIDGLPVLEPIDIVASALGLHVLDRAGNVYLLAWGSPTWTMERNDRPIKQSSSHYFTALDVAADSRYLLETSYSYGIRYDQLQLDSWAGWALEDAYFVDLAAAREEDQSAVYVLQRRRDSEAIELLFYQQGELNRRFKPRLDITRPRALARWQDQLFLLDDGGRRLTAFEAETGLLLDGYPLVLPLAISALTVRDDGQVLLAGRDAIYLPGAFEMSHVVPDPAIVLTGRWPHDPAVLATLPEFIPPIPNLPISDRDLRMPGAPRHYRLGIHEGADFYWGPGREVGAAAAGTIVRADFDYRSPTEGDFRELRALATNQGYSSPEMLDFFRGRQVWIDHGGGIVTRYAHLATVNSSLIEGQTVAAGQIIGTVGNSGSPGSLVSASEDAHLHFEIWIDDHYVGEFLRPIEIREVFEGIIK